MEDGALEPLSLDNMSDDQLEQRRKHLKSELECTRYIDSLPEQQFQKRKISTQLNAVKAEINRRKIGGLA